MVEQSKDGVMIVQDGICKFANKAVAEITGRAVEEAVGMSFVKLVVPEDRALVVRRYKLRMAGEKVPPFFETKIQHKDGTIKEVEVSTELIQYDGRPAELATVRDITERKQMEEALRESEERFQTLFDAMSEGVILMDATGRVLQANPAAEHIFRLEYSELGERDYNSLRLGIIKPDGSPMHPEEMTSLRAMKEKRLVMDDLMGIKYSDGTISWLIVNAIPLFDDKNELGGIVTTFVDISGRKRAEEEREALLQDIKKINRKLEESNKELQDFAYIASHDLREPLRKISSFSALLQDSLKGKLDEDQQENLEFMIDGAERMQNMIDDLLTYSRLTTRAKPPQRVDLNEVVEDVKKLELAALLDETKGTIHVPELLPPVQADPSQMHQLFQNLIGNGLKFHKEGIPPEITIRARQAENNMIRIEVEDNGIGIDEEYHEQVFVMFKRLHSREQYEGTGIGLAACKKIVNRHGGDIGVKSTPGEGSTFWFTLPRGSYSGDNSK